MKISLAGLAPGLHSFHHADQPSAWGLENHPNLTGTVEVAVELQRGATHLYVRSRVRTVGHFVCDRCLQEFELPLDETGRVIFTSDPDLLLQADDEVRRFDPDVREIDLSDDIRDFLLLAIPSKLVCREDCKGLCAGCGANLNFEACRCAAPAVDVRWQALQKLLK